MSPDETSEPTQCIAHLARRVAAEPRFRAELERARRQFFGEGGRGRDDAAEHRFAEWFLLERESDALGAVPTEVSPYADDADAISGSIAGLFVVEAVGETTTATDVQNGETVELAAPGSLEPGDLLVGRLYPARGERWSPSAATPALRPGRELATAFARDLERLGLERRLHQIELEHLLLQRYRGHASLADARRDDEPIVPGPPPMPAAPLEHLEADLEQLLQASGDRHSATTISAQLAVAERPGAFIGPLLDQLAFDTDVDLDKARRLLLEIWNAHHAGSAGDTPDAQPSSGAPGESLGEELVRRLDQGLGEHQDVEQLFAQLEKIAGIEPDDDEDDDDRATDILDAVAGAVAGGDDGDLGPLVTEYYWEIDQQDPIADDREPSAAERGPLALWVELQRNAPVPNTDLESIGAQDLMRLLLHVYLRSGPHERAEQVRATFDELRRFYEWVRTSHELDRLEVLDACRGALLDDLDRLQQAGMALSNDGTPARAPGLLQIEEIGADGFGARDDDGGSHWVLVGGQALPHLAVGDLVLGGLGAPTGDEPSSLHARLAGLVVVLPIDARSLIE